MEENNDIPVTRLLSLGTPDRQASDYGLSAGQYPCCVPSPRQYQNLPAPFNGHYPDFAAPSGLYPPTGYGPETGQYVGHGAQTGCYHGYGDQGGHYHGYGDQGGHYHGYGEHGGHYHGYGERGGHYLTYGERGGHYHRYGEQGGHYPPAVSYQPTVQNFDHGAPPGLKPGSPSGQNPGLRAPPEQNSGLGAPPGQNTGLGAPPGQNTGLGAPPGQNTGLGAPPGQNTGLGAPPGLQPGSPSGQNPGLRAPPEQKAHLTAPPGQNSGLGAPPGQNTEKTYAKPMTSGPVTHQKDDMEEVSSMMLSLSISSNKSNHPHPVLGEMTPSSLSKHAAHHEEGTDLQGSSSKKPEKADQYLKHMVMVSGINPDSQEDDLVNFLEAVLDDDVVQIKYTEDRDVAVVVFQGSEDFEERATEYHKKQKKSFFGQIPRLTPLLPSCCISVHGIGNDLVQGSLEKYFESRECGNDHGARVVDSLTKHDEGYAVLTFEDPEVVKKVLMKTEHKLDGKCISVHEYYMETGTPVFEKDEMKLTTVVDDLQLVEARLLMVMKFPEDCAAKWRGFSAVCDGKSSIVFEGFRQDVQSAVEDLNNMRDTTCKHMMSMQGLSAIQFTLLQKDSITEHIFQQISEKTIQGAWHCNEKQRSVTVKAMSGRDLTRTKEIIDESVTVKSIQALSLKPDDKELLDQGLSKALKDYTNCFLYKCHTDFVIVCAPEKYISHLTRTAERIVKETLFETRKRKTPNMDEKQLIVDQKSSVSRLVYQLKPIQAKFIHVKMQEDIHELASSLGVTITLDPAGNGLIVRGPERELKEAQGFLRSKDKTLKVKEVREEGPYVTKLEKSGLIPVIAEYAEKAIRCVVIPVIESPNSDREEWWTTSTGLHVHVFQGAVAKLRVHAVIILVDEYLKPMDRFATTVQEKGGNVVKEEVGLYLSSNGVMKQGQVLVTGAGEVNYGKIIHVCFKKERRSEEEMQHALSTALTECLEEAHKNNFESIAIPTFGHIGDEMKVTQIVTSTLGNFFMASPTCSIKYVYLLSRNERSFNAFTTNGKIYLQEKGQARMKTNRSQRVFAPGLQVNVVTDDLAEQKVDVIVNTVNVDLNLDAGAISKSLLKAGGSSLQTECKSRYPGGVSTGKFVRTRGHGKLKCKEVYHCCLPSKNSTELSKVFKRLIQEMLQTASDAHHSTIAFPSLGTGNVGYKHKDVAAWMFEAVRLHKEKKPKSHLTGITMVIHHKDFKSKEAFTEMHEKYKEKLHGTAGTIAKAPQKTYAAAAAGHSANSRSKKRNRPDIVLKEGEIADQQVDVIVNTASYDLDLTKGNVSRSILTKGGKTIQDEVTAKCGHKPNIPDGNFVVSRGGKLKCKFIYHGVLHSWGSYSSHKITNTEFLANLMTKFLDKASSHGSQTIAFPALGTGLLGYPHEVVAKTMYDVVKNYGPTSLTTVFFVVYDKDTKSKVAFKKEHGRYKTEIQSPPRSVGSHSGKRSLLDVVTVKVGNILTENCDCIVVPVDPYLDFGSGTISRQLLEAKFWPKLLTACHDQNWKLLENGVLLVSSFETCTAKMVLLVNRDRVKTNQQLVLSTSIATAVKENNYELAFPILVSGRKKENAVHLARDLCKALEEFDEGSLETLRDIRVIVSDNDMKAAFESELRLCKKMYPEKQNLASGSQAFGQETLETVAQSTTPPSHNHACFGYNNSAHQSSKTKVTYQVASDQEISIEEAMDILQRLSTDSQNVKEEICDDRLQSRQLQIEDLSQKFEVKVKVSTGKVILVGTSFKVCQALKEILEIISSLPNVTYSNNKAETTTASRQNSESHKHSFSDRTRSKPCTVDRILKSVHQDVRPKTIKSYQNNLPSNTYIPIHVSVEFNENEMYGSGSMTDNRLVSMETENTDTVDRTKAESAPDTPINDFDENTEGETYGSGHLTGSRQTSMETENTDSVDRSTAASRSFHEAGQEHDKVEWFFVEDTEEGLGLQSYDTMTSKIEAAYLNGDSSVILHGQEEDQYQIDFDRMEEYEMGNEMDRVPVIRRQKLAEATTMLPEKLKGIDPYGMKLVPLVRSASEFLKVTEMFTSSTHLPPSSLVKIEEILNVSLYKSYESKKAQMLTQGLKEEELSERQLWHGPLVNTDVIVSLSHFGFNRNYCNYTEEDDLGQGVYFHTNIAPILKTSQADPSGHHHVCLSKVLTGRSRVGRQTYRDAPDASHSVVDIDSNPSKFAVFFDNQALPLYLLTFTAEHK